MIEVLEELGASAAERDEGRRQALLPRRCQPDPDHPAVPGARGSDDETGSLGAVDELGCRALGELEVVGDPADSPRLAPVGSPLTARSSRYRCGVRPQPRTVASTCARNFLSRRRSSAAAW